jgi:hypothetical protein
VRCVPVRMPALILSHEGSLTSRVLLRAGPPQPTAVARFLRLRAALSVALWHRSRDYQDCSTLLWLGRPGTGPSPDDHLLCQ